MCWPVTWCFRCTPENSTILPTAAWSPRAANLSGPAGSTRCAAPPCRCSSCCRDFPASGAGAHARLFRPAFRARCGAVSGVVRALRNLPVPDGTDRCRRSVARRLPHPGQFRCRDRTPLVRLYAAGTLPVRSGCLAVDRDGFAPRYGGLSRALGLHSVHPLCAPRFPGAARRMFLERHADALLLSGFLGYMVLAAYLRRYHAAPRAWHKWGVALLVVAGISRRHGFSTHGWRRSGSSRTSNFRGASGRSTWPRCRSGCSCC